MVPKQNCSQGLGGRKILKSEYLPICSLVLLYLLDVAQLLGLAYDIKIYVLNGLCLFLLNIFANSANISALFAKRFINLNLVQKNCCNSLLNRGESWKLCSAVHHMFVLLIAHDCCAG